MKLTISTIYLLVALFPVDCLGGVPSDLPNVDHLLIVESGTVELKRLSWTNYTPVTLSAVLRRGDLIKVSSSAKANVVCSDLELHRLDTHHINGVPCVPAKAYLRIRAGRIIPPRSSDFREYPRLLSPRRTKLLRADPVIRWQQISSAERYEVNIYGRKRNWILHAQSKNYLQTSNFNEVKLRRGQTYLVVITANHRRSSWEDAMGLEFTLLTEKQYEEITELTHRIRGLNLGLDHIRFIIAYLYASYGLNAEAIEIFDGLRDSLQTSVTSRLIGELHMKTGVFDLAEKYLKEASELAEGIGNHEGVALAQAKLGRIYRDIFGRRIEYRKCMRKMASSYEALGDDLAAAKARRGGDSMKGHVPTRRED